MRRLLGLIGAALVGLALAAGAVAAQLKPLLDALGRGSFDDREKAIAALAASGAPQAATVIRLEQERDELARRSLRTLDHIVVAGNSSLSFAERGLL